MVNNPPSTGNQLITTYSSLNNFRQDIIRLDQNVGDKVRIYGRYMEDVVPTNAPFSLWGGGNYPGVETTSINSPGRNLVLNATMSISPRVVNEVEFVDAWGAINSDLTHALTNCPAFTGQLTNNTAFPDPYGRAPNVSINGYTGLGNGSAPVPRAQHRQNHLRQSFHPTRESHDPSRVYLDVDAEDGEWRWWGGKLRFQQRQ